MTRSGGDRKAAGERRGWLFTGRENREASITRCKFPSGEAGWRGAHSVRGASQEEECVLERERHSLS